jgi:hypothetical protein
MTRVLSAVALCWWISLLWSCWILQRASAAPFLSKMSLTFRRNSLVRLSYFDALESHTIMLKLKRRGGGQGTSTLTSSSSSINAPTTNTTANADTLATATISTPLNETTASDVLTDSKEESVPYNFSLFQKGDGSETDPDGIPGRWLRMQKGHREKAKEALQATLEWRRDQNVDIILSKPHVKFDVCKRVLPHYFSGRDATGHVIFVQRPGKIQTSLAEANNVTNDDLLYHYVFVLEYCWNEIEPRPDQTMTSVIDLGGLHFHKVRKMLHFVKQFVNMMSQHYPQRSYKTLLINSPKWFGATYRMISPMLRESTRSKIEILSGGTRQREILIKYLGNHAPKELLYGDSSDTLVVAEEDHTGPHSSMEKMIRAFVMERLDETGEVMQPVLELE